MDKLTPKNHAEEVALFRSQVIGSLSRRDFAHGELRAVLVALSAERFRAPGIDHSRTFSVPTLERWYYAYREGGLAALSPKPRSDRGHAQQLTPQMRELLCDIRRQHPAAAVALILRTLIADGRLAKGTVSVSTARRFFVEQGLDRVPLRDGTGDKMRLRWQAERPGALWHGDVCHGLPITIGGVSKPLRIHALLDDASRFLVAIEAHHSEREIDMLGLFVRALRRYGAPDALYLDNGSTYRGDTLRIACERLGVTLLHARPYDAPARGKMERFWRTLREGCLDFLGAACSLDDVHAKLRAFVQTHYHQAPHGSLMGRAPGIVFAEGVDARPSDITEERLRMALTTHEKRRVRNDTTIAIDGTDWELDQGFLAGRVVTVGRNLVNPDDPPWVEYEGKRLQLHPVDPIRNARKKRLPKKPAAPAPAANVPFDPNGPNGPNAPVGARCADDHSHNPNDEEIF